jgi:hypothetical protein
MEAPRSLSGSRRHHRARCLARGLGLGALTLALSGPVVASSSAAAGTAISLALPNGLIASIPSSALTPTAEHLVSEQCVLRGRPGDAPAPTTHGGLPVAKALETYAGVTSFGYLSIPRPNGTVAYLPEQYFYEPSPFEGCKFPTFSYDEGSARFFRPPLAGDANDVNAEDFIATVSGEALAVGVHEGKVVEVQVSPPSASTLAGSPVQLTAAVSDGEVSETFTYAWSFGDGTTAEGESVTHSFAGSGTYLVRVTAHGSAGSGGESGPVEVVVGNPPTTAQPGATTTPQRPTKTPKGAPGKGREGRGGKGSTPAPSGGKKKKGKDDSSARRGGSPAGRSHPRDSPESPTPATSPLAPPEVVPTLPPPPPVEPSGGGPAEPPRCCSAGSPPEGSPLHSPSRPSTTEGELVEGRLVGDDLGPATLEEAVGGSSEGGGSRSAPGAVGKGGVGVPVGALIVVALLAGGALFEWRRSRPSR